MKYTMEIGKTYLITTDELFVAPDGNQYRAAFGTLKAILDDNDALGVRTNRNATNWFAQIGNMLIAGCQIHYCIRTETASFEPASVSDFYEGKLVFSKDLGSRIYNADMNHETVTSAPNPPADS